MESNSAARSAFMPARRMPRSARPTRVAGLEVPIPYAKHLEIAAIPQVADIVAAAIALVGASP